MYKVIFKIPTYSLAVLKSFFHKICVSIYIHIVGYLKEIQMHFFYPSNFYLNSEPGFQKICDSIVLWYF